MASTLDEINDTANHPGFRRRIESAIVKAAVQIGNETRDGSQRSLARQALVVKVLEHPEDYGDKFSFPVAANASITTASTDTDIDWTVAAVWDAMANAEPEQATTTTTTTDPTTATGA